MVAMWLIGEVTINGDVPENIGCGVQCWVVWLKYRMVKETHNEATVWFWFASWPVIWEMMDRFAGYMFSVEWQIVVMRVEGGTKKAANPEVSPPAAMVLQVWMHWWVISFVSMEKGTAAMDLRAQRQGDNG
eukprot:scaffold31041_cov56-Attheya_sp.AAC.1